MIPRPKAQETITRRDRIIIDADTILVHALGDDAADIPTLLDWIASKAFLTAVERFQGPDYDRIDRAAHLLSNCLERRVERAYRSARYSTTRPAVNRRRVSGLDLSERWATDKPRTRP